jgi:hypothetical protein
VGKIRFSLKTSKQTYGLEPERTVQSVTEDFILINHPKAPIFLFWGCFSKVMTNRRFSTNLENSNHLEYSETLYNPGEF